MLAKLDRCQELGPASTIIRRSPVTSIAIRRSVECAAMLRDRTAGDASHNRPDKWVPRGLSDSLRNSFASKERDRPYRHAGNVVRTELSKKSAPSPLQASPGHLKYLKSIQRNDRILSCVKFSTISLARRNVSPRRLTAMSTADSANKFAVNQPCIGSFVEA
ncbi:hypothetical protein GGD63_007233 [Bradyrhizobium sp. cir1]|nr:hypothetical protein [Bradyrhizobium sp. cir1]